MTSCSYTAKAVSNLPYEQQLRVTLAGVFKPTIEQLTMFFAVCYGQLDDVIAAFERASSPKTLAELMFCDGALVETDVKSRYVDDDAGYVFDHAADGRTLVDTIRMHETIGIYPKNCVFNHNSAFQELQENSIDLLQQIHLAQIFEHQKLYDICSKVIVRLVGFGRSELVFDVAVVSELLQDRKLRSAYIDRLQSLSIREHHKQQFQRLSSSFLVELFVHDGRCDIHEHDGVDDSDEDEWAGNDNHDHCI